MRQTDMTIRLAVLALAVLVLHGCQAPGAKQKRQEQATKRWRIARASVKAQLAADQLEKGRIADAAGQLDEALRLDPNNAELRLMQARVSLARGNDGAALEILERLDQDHGPSPEGHYLIGIICQQRLKWLAAEEYFLSALEQSPTEIAYLSAAVQTRLQSGQPEGAWALLDEYADEQGHTPAYHACVAECAELVGDWERAAAAWRRVADGQDDPAIGERVSLALYRAGKWSEAATLIEQLIAQQSPAPGSALRHVLSECLIELGELDHARRQISIILKESPRDARAQWALARVLVGIGETRRAWRVAEQALLADPENLGIVELVATLAYRNGDEARAASLARSLMRHEPGNAVAERLISLTADASGEK